MRLQLELANLARNGQDVYQLLIDHGAKLWYNSVEFYNDEVFPIAIRQNDLETVKSFIEKGEEVDDDTMALSVSLEMNKLLLSAVDPASVTDFQIIQLHVAAEYGLVDIVDALLSHEPNDIGFLDVKRQCGYFGRRPLITACKGCQPSLEIIEALLKHGADSTAACDSGWEIEKIGDTPCMFPKFISVWDES